MTIEEIKKTYFRENEEILWSGTADKLKYFSRTDFIIVPLTLIFGLFLLCYAFAAFMLMITGQSMAFALSGITVVLVAFYIMFGRIWYRRKKLSKNLYFVTNRRVFVFNTFRNTVSVDIDLLLTETSCVHNDLYLSAKLLGGDIACALGLDLFLYNIVRPSPAFYSINNPEKVMRIIDRAKKNRKVQDDDSDFI